MAVKVFLLGRPGSGKSTAARRLMKLAGRVGWSAVHINDYKILHEWFTYEQRNRENGHKYFCPSEHGGFDVVDFSILARVMEEVKKRAQTHANFERKLILIEFARDDYSEVLRTFTDDFLHDAYFLFFDADLDTCIERVYKRSLHPVTEDDHFVSDTIFKRYYYRDNTDYITSQLAKDYGLDDKKVEVINNRCSLDSFIQRINQYFITHLKDELAPPQRLSPSLKALMSPQSKVGRNTEPLNAGCPESKNKLQLNL